MLEFFRDNPVAAVIVACEVGLWAVLVVGLALRYLAGLRRTGAVVLAGIPLLDVVLVVAAALDLQRGAEPDGVHGLAGIYLGVSLAFGPQIVRWADVRFAHRFAGGPPPVKHARGSAERVGALWREWGRVVVAATIATAVLLFLAFGFAEADQRDVLQWWAVRAWVVTGLWLVFGPLWEAATPVRSRPSSPASSARRRDGSTTAAGAGRSDDSP